MNLENYLNKNKKLKAEQRKEGLSGGVFLNKDGDIRKKQLFVVMIYYVLLIFTAWFLFGGPKISLEVVRLAYALVFFGLLPTLLVRKGFRDNLSEYNIPIGYFKKQIVLAVGTVWLSSLLIWIFMLQWGGKMAGNVIWWNSGMVWLATKNLLLMPIGLLMQEFFFRGIVLNIFRKNFSDGLSVMIVSFLVVLFVMVVTKHWIGWLAGGGIILFNMVLGRVVIRLKSVVFSFWLYWWGLVLLNFLVLWQLGSRIN